MKTLTQQQQQALLLSLLIHGLVLWTIHATSFQNASKVMPTLEVQLPPLPTPKVTADLPPSPPVQVPRKAPLLPSTPAIIATKQPTISEQPIASDHNPVEPAPVQQQLLPQPVETGVAEPTPAPPSTSNPSSAERRRTYVLALGTEIQKQKNYPFVARMRKWQGSVMVAIRLSNSGQLMDSRIAVPSGYEVLDGEAMKMVSRASPHFTPPPSDLVGDWIQIPIQFLLTN